MEQQPQSRGAIAMSIRLDRLAMYQSRAEQFRKEETELARQGITFPIEAKGLVGPTPRSGRFRRPLMVLDGVALISVKGVLTKGSSFFSLFGLEVSMEEVQDLLREAAQRADVFSVLVDGDTPGGTVAGTDETAAVLKEVARIKPVVFYGSGDVCSAGYWIASAANKIVVSPSTEVGSIGVVAMHLDASGFEQRIGVKWTEVTSGKYKRIASEHGPLTDEGRAYLQELVDAHFKVFVETVAANRGMTVEDVLSVGDGRVFIGKDALGKKLIDGIAGFDDALKMAQAMGGKGPKSPAPAAQARDRPGEPTATRGIGDFINQALNTQGKGQDMEQEKTTLSEQEGQELDDALERAMKARAASKSGMPQGRGLSSDHRRQEQDPSSGDTEAEAQEHEAAFDRALERAMEARNEQRRQQGFVRI